MVNFLFVPSKFSEGWNAYRIGWRATSHDVPGLTFITNDKKPSLQIEGFDVGIYYAVEFDFSFTNRLQVEFNITWGEKHNTSDFEIGMRFMRSNITVFQTTLYHVGDGTYRVYKYDSSDVLYYLYKNSKVIQSSTLNADTGGVDGLLIEMSGVDGQIIFVGLKGTSW